MGHVIERFGAFRLISLFVYGSLAAFLTVQEGFLFTLVFFAVIVVAIYAHRRWDPRWHC